MSCLQGNTASVEIHDNSSFTHQTAARRTAQLRRSGLLGLAGLLLASAGVRAQSTFPATPVNTPASSVTQSVTVTVPSTFTGTGTVTAVQVLTQGAQGSGLDFTKAANQPGSSSSPAGCDSISSLTAGQKCTENVTFAPTAPGLRTGAVVVVGTFSGQTTVLGATLISGTGQGGLGVLAPGNVFSVAGTLRTYSDLGDDGLATKANLYLPMGVVLDGNGNMYIADTSSDNRVRMVCGASGMATIAGTNGHCSGTGDASVISTIAGDGSPGYAGNGGLASAATLDSPSGLAIDGAGNLYITDTGNNEIREINAATGIISLVAGGATTLCGGKSDAFGDGCIATSATLNGPRGVTVDTAGDLFIADTGNNLIREVTAGTQIITVVAGNGTAGYGGDKGPAAAAELNRPYAVAFDGTGNMYIPDSANDIVRKVTPSGTISTFAGIDPILGVPDPGYSGNGEVATAAQLWSPSGVAVDPAGNVYIADTQNAAIRKVNVATGDIATLAVNNAGSSFVPPAGSPVTLVTNSPMDRPPSLWIARGIITLPTPSTSSSRRSKAMKPL